MKINTADLYRDAITVLNKLDARDAMLQKDAWYKTVLHGCLWSQQVSRTVAADGTVNIGSSFRIQIPRNESYLRYSEWLSPDKRDSHFTIRQGDYIIRGEVVEEITPETIRAIVELYEPEACQVKTFRDLTNAALGYRAVNLMRFAEILEIEGA